ncbi:hypothetical protein DY000_02062360 [Brassica cretica]|uniref:Uncharacterized protein n=1 Tax=Brassica cretica TaxID=69181 RepID=A0ABQ7B1Q7_BRACR|nr:hypothetical protein DY000_02062360 [Brassica cretica]
MLLVLTPTDYERRRDRSRLQKGEKRGSWPESKLVSSSLIEDIKIDLRKRGRETSGPTWINQVLRDSSQHRRRWSSEGRNIAGASSRDRDFTGTEKREKTASETRRFRQEREKYGGIGWYALGLSPKGGDCWCCWRKSKAHVVYTGPISCASPRQKALGLCC